MLPAAFTRHEVVAAPARIPSATEERASSVCPPQGMADPKEGPARSYGASGVFGGRGRPEPADPHLRAHDPRGHPTPSPLAGEPRGGDVP